MGKNFGHDTAQEVTPMEAVFKMIEQENLELKNEIRELEAKLQAVSQKYSENEAKRKQEYQNQLLQEQASCKRTIEEARQNIGGMQQELNSARKLANGLQQQLKTEKNRADDLQTKLAAERKITSELRPKADQQPRLQEQLAKYQTDKAREITELKNTMHSLQVKLTDKNKKMGIQAVVFVLLLIIACLPSVYFYLQIQEYQSGNLFLSQQAERLRDEAASLAEDMEFLQETYGSMEEENASLKLEIAALEAENSALESDSISVRKENSTLSETLTSLKATYQKIQPEYEFYHEHAVIVYDNNTRLYHQYGCSKGNSQRFWIYNSELAKAEGYTPCSTCLPNVS